MQCDRSLYVPKRRRTGDVACLYRADGSMLYAGRVDGREQGFELPELKELAPSYMNAYFKTLMDKAGNAEETDKLLVVELDLADLVGNWAAAQAARAALEAGGAAAGRALERLR